jgi:hypothetical protein
MLLIYNPPIALMSPPTNVAKNKLGNDVVLSWSANSEANLTGYKLYYGNPTGLSYENVIDLGNDLVMLHIP